MFYLRSSAVEREDAAASSFAFVRLASEVVCLVYQHDRHCDALGEDMTSYERLRSSLFLFFSCPWPIGSFASLPPYRLQGVHRRKSLQFGSILHQISKILS